LKFCHEHPHKTKINTTSEAYQTIPKSQFIFYFTKNMAIPANKAAKMRILLIINR